MARLPIGYTVRKAIVTKVARTYVECEWFDRIGEKSFRCPMPQPYAGRGGGVLVGFERDTTVLVAYGPQERPYIVAVVPDRNYYFDLSGQTDSRIEETPYPELSEGEVVVKANAGQYIKLSSNGNLILDAGIGGKSADMELSLVTETLFNRINNTYTFTEAGRYIEGIVKRDMTSEEDVEDASTINFLSGESYDSLLEIVGRCPTDEVQVSNTDIIKTSIRNPALVEKREITYEYADSFCVKDFNSEILAMSSSPPGDPFSSLEAIQNDPTIRENRRTDILNLNLRNYNHLIEKTEGTVVDIYGNILDINRNIIPVPDADAISSKSPGTKDLRYIYDYLRRSIKYHLEINSRKSIGDNPSISPSQKIDAANGYEHSRWSFDVDAEGLTKVNIPATSETGNVPVLCRYFVSEDINVPGDGSFRDGNNKDVRVAQFGARKIKDDGTLDDTKFAGQAILDTSYIPEDINESTVTVGTAYHDMMKVAESIFSKGKFKNPEPVTPFVNNEIVLPMSESIDNTIKGPNSVDEPTANAGGRSIHANLDGSVEMSIGADSVDRKSMMIDMSGGIISHVGRDKNGRSIIQQFDGDVLIQIGGHGVNDTRKAFSKDQYATERPGRLEIHLYRVGKDASPQVIIIDENGLTLDVKGNMVLKSTGDMSLEALGNLLLSGENTYFHGKADLEERRISGKERRIGRVGRTI